MKQQLLRSHTEIRISTINDAGYGVFALKNFRKNEVIEECPFITLKKEISKELSDDLKDYVFSQKNSELNALPLGNGCIYNHSELPNATWVHDEDKKLFIFKALKDIHKGEEIFTYYSPQWFLSRGKNANEPYKITKKLLTLLARTGFVVLLFTILITALLPHKVHSKIDQKNWDIERTLIKKTNKTQ